MLIVVSHVCVARFEYKRLEANNLGKGKRTNYHRCDVSAIADVESQLSYATSNGSHGDEARVSRAHTHHSRCTNRMGFDLYAEPRPIRVCNHTRVRIRFEHEHSGYSTNVCHNPGCKFPHAQNARKRLELGEGMGANRRCHDYSTAFSSTSMYVC